MRDNGSGVVSRVGRRVRRWSTQMWEPWQRGMELEVGASDDPRDGPDGLPMPPGRLMHLVAASRDDAWFLEGGRLAASGMMAILARNGIAPERLGAILDFGCGAGRVLRHWKGLYWGNGTDQGGPTLHGTDYNPELVAWCAANLPFAECRVNHLVGGLDYPDATFDLVYAFSVFTHLTAERQAFWIAELSRVLIPGGSLFLTTHGEHYLSRLSPAEQVTFRAGDLVVRGSKRAGSNDCAAFHPESYVRKNLARHFEVVEFVPEGAKGNPRQDAYLLRKPG
jgi:SAM-dependent methyltransferase